MYSYLNRYPHPFPALREDCESALSRGAVFKRAHERRTLSIISEMTEPIVLMYVMINISGTRICIPIIFALHR